MFDSRRNLCATAAIASILTLCAACSLHDAPPRSSQNNPITELIPGAIKNGVIYLEIPLSADIPFEARENFVRSVVLDQKWWHEGRYFAQEGYGGIVTPSDLVDMQRIANSTTYSIGQSLQVRTPQRVISARITGFEVTYAEIGGRYILAAVANIEKSELTYSDYGHVVAARDLKDCGKACNLSRSKPNDAEIQKIRLAAERAGVHFPSSVPQDDRAETMIAYTGHFTRKDRTQYVAFLARHAKRELEYADWATLVIDSDFSILAVFGQNDPTQIIPDGLADIDGDGLDEVWTDELYDLGAAYSVWYLSSVSPTRFDRIRWQPWSL